MREEELLGSLINVIGVSVEYKSNTTGLWLCLGGCALWVGVSAWASVCDYICI